MSDSDTDSDLNPEPQPQSGLNQTNCREFLFVIEDVPSRIAHGETFYTPIQGFPRLLAFVDFGGENVVRCGLKYIGKGQVKPLYQFIVHPFETTPLDMALDRWKIGPKVDPIRHPQIQAFPTKNGIRLSEWSHHYDRNDLQMYLELEIIPGEELTRAQESESKSELHKDLLKLLDDAPFSDLTIVVGEGDKKKSFKAHKSILATRSEYFRGLYESGMEDARRDLLEYEDLDAEAFGSYLKFLYAGALPFESTDDDECPLVYRPFIPLEEPLEKATNLWVVANLFVAPDLEKTCEKLIFDHLVQRKADIVLRCLAFAYKYESSLPTLLESSLLYVRSSLRVLRATEEWREMEKDQPELVDLVLQSESAE